MTPETDASDPTGFDWIFVVLGAWFVGPDR